MHAFLMGSLGEHGLRRLAKVVDQAEQTVHAILLDQVFVRGVGGGPGRADSACHTAGPGVCVWGGSDSATRCLVCSQPPSCISRFSCQSQLTCAAGIAVTARGSLCAG